MSLWFDDLLTQADVTLSEDEQVRLRLVLRRHMLGERELYRDGLITLFQMVEDNFDQKRPASFILGLVMARLSDRLDYWKKAQERLESSIREDEEKAREKDNPRT